MADKITDWIGSVFISILNCFGEICQVLSTLFVKADLESSQDFGIMAQAEAASVNIIKNAYTVMQGIGLAIALLFFLIALLELITQDRLTIEYFAKFFGRLAISVALILICPTLVEKISDFASAFSTEVSGIDFSGSFIDGSNNLSDAISSKEGEINDIFSGMGEGLNWIIMLVEFIMTFCVISIVSLVLMVVAYILALTRIIEMTARGVFLPIAFGLMSDDGWRGAGGRYIRKYVAILCQGAVIVVIAKVMTALMVSVFTTQISQMAANVGDGGFATDLMETAATVGNPIGLLLFLLGICIAGISVMFKSIGIVNDLFGA